MTQGIPGARKGMSGFSVNPKRCLVKGCSADITYNGRQNHATLWRRSLISKVAEIIKKN